MLIDASVIDGILDIVPERARACYTGQSILAYCPDPTFTYEEMDVWADQTDIDLFAYSNTAHASIVQAYVSAGWGFPTPIDSFKGERIRFFEPNRKYELQTVVLAKDGYPMVNITWMKHVEDALDCVKRFDMDYLMVALDLRTGTYADLRPENRRVAHVNPYNHRFDPLDVNPSYWYRQFDRCPKGWSRGIDTRPVAEQYRSWIRYSLDTGDRTLGSKTRMYANRAMEQAISAMKATGISHDQAETIYHMVKGEEKTWASQKLKYEVQLKRIEDWLDAVKDL